MKNSRKLITLVLLALALNAIDTSAEAKTRRTRPNKKSVVTEETRTNDVKKDVLNVTSISFSGLESL